LNNWRLLPKNPKIAKYLDSYWFLKKDPDDLTEQFPKLYPDPAAHLLLIAEGLPYVYQYGSNKIIGSGSNFLCPHRATFTIDHSQPFESLSSLSTIL